MPEREEWARTRVRSSRHARRGAWYRVILATPHEGTLLVNHQPLTVPRSFLQTRSRHLPGAQPTASARAVRLERRWDSMP